MVVPCGTGWSKRRMARFARPRPPFRTEAAVGLIDRIGLLQNYVGVSPKTMIPPRGGQWCVSRSQIFPAPLANMARTNNLNVV
jgi:hypothetical protein